MIFSQGFVVTKIKIDLLLKTCAILSLVKHFPVTTYHNQHHYPVLLLSNMNCCSIVALYEKGCL